MKQPIYVYYQLENFYQNHRRYITLVSNYAVALYNFVLDL